MFLTKFASKAKSLAQKGLAKAAPIAESGLSSAKSLTAKAAIKVSHSASDAATILSKLNARMERHDKRIMYVK